MTDQKTQNIKDKLKAMGITLPEPKAPVANYVPFVQVGTTLYISGQLPVDANGTLAKGRLGDNTTAEEGQAAAKLCAVHLLAQLSAALGGDFSRLVRLVKLGGFVACTPEFFDHSKVINGASDLMVAVLGDAGKHARFAVGVPSLPLGAAVEVDAIFEIK